MGQHCTLHFRVPRPAHTGNRERWCAAHVPVARPTDDCVALTSGHSQWSLLATGAAHAHALRSSAAELALATVSPPPPHGCAGRRRCAGFLPRRHLEQKKNKMAHGGRGQRQPHSEGEDARGCAGMQRKGADGWRRAGCSMLSGASRTVRRAANFLCAIRGAGGFSGTGARS
jgi:hypothetical protein